MKSLVKRGRREGGWGVRDRHGSRDHGGARALEEKERGSRAAQKCRVNMALEWLGIAPGPAVLSKPTWWDARQSMRHQLASIYGYIVTGPYSAARPLLASPHARLKHSCQSPSDSTSDCPTAILLAKNYFNLLSYPSTLPSPSTSGSSSACSNPTATGDGFTRPFSRSFFAQSAPWFMETRLLMSRRTVLNIRLLRGFCGFLHGREDWIKQRGGGETRMRTSKRQLSQIYKIPSSKHWDIVIKLLIIISYSTM